MILTITINPLLEHILSYNNVKTGTENRNPEEKFRAGGKGINVSRQLNIFSLDNLAFTFTGGNTGRILKKVLTEEKINHTSISTLAETRLSSIIIDKSAKSVSSYFGNDPKITLSEVEGFKNKLEKMIQNCEMVVFSGSSPCEETNSIFPFGIRAANSFDKISICDTYGSHLKDCIDAAPTILHNNFSEIEKSLNYPLTSKKEIVTFLKLLHSKNIKQAFITDGANDSYASNFDFIFKVINPKVQTVDSTGSGDAFTAGIIYGWHHNLPFQESLIFASAIGAVNAEKYEVCTVSIDEADNVISSVRLVAIGKKMRSIDV